MTRTRKTSTSKGPRPRASKEKRNLFDDLILEAREPQLSMDIDSREERSVRRERMNMIVPELDGGASLSTFASLWSLYIGKHFDAGHGSGDYCETEYFFLEC